MSPGLRRLLPACLCFAVACVARVAFAAPNGPGVAIPPDPVPRTEASSAQHSAVGAKPNPASMRQAAGLVADVKRVVAAEESLGWVVDHVELADMYPTLLKSLCRATPEARSLALSFLELEQSQHQSADQIYQAEGHQLTDEVEQALSAERRLHTMRHAIAGAERDCPFWLEVDPEFEGLQTDRNRFAVNVESGGVAILRQTNGGWTFGAGGFGRVLPSYGFNGEWTLLGGAEFGGGALIRPGEETTGVAVNYFMAAPWIARLRDVAWHYDIEFAPVALFQTDNTKVSYGARVGTTIGISALYTTGFIPWAGASLAYEYYLDSGERAAAHFIRGGFRAGISWDP